MSFLFFLPLLSLSRNGFWFDCENKILLSFFFFFSFLFLCTEILEIFVFLKLGFIGNWVKKKESFYIFGF